MKSMLRNSVLALTLLGTAIGATAQQTPVIQGYFRIQNVGNNKFVEVTGPFTAKPNLTQAEANNSAGTVMYVEAVQNGDSYLLTHLRCQGIDVVEASVIDPADYQSMMQSVLEGGNPAYGLVRQGFEYGYTSVARAAVGCVFAIVASKLETYVTDEDKSENGDYKFYKDDYLEVANDFNANVTATLDLGIRLKPVSFDNKTVQVYFDVPSLQPVCDWYLDTDAKLFESTNNPVSRHDVFASAMRAMTNYLAGKGINLETLLPQDVALLESWNYDVTADYPANAEGEVVLTFDQIFSDNILLFNWIKMVGYYILTPDKDPHNLSALGFGDLGSSAKNHYITSLFVDYLPRLHYNTRAFLINGRVGEADSFGGSWDSSADGTLGFAGEFEVGNAGANSQWALVPIDNDSQKLIIALDKETTLDDYSGYYNGYFFDFPVSTNDDATFLTLGELKTVSYTQSGVEVSASEDMVVEYTMTYTDLTELGTSVDEQTPFIINSELNEIQLNVADGACTFEAISAAGAQNGSKTLALAGAPRKAAEAASDDDENSSGAMKGILLETAYDSQALQDYWGIDAENSIYRFAAQQVGSSQHLEFNTNKNTPLRANSVVYVSPVNITYDILFIGKPTIDDLTSGVVSIEADRTNDDAFYNLNGVRVMNPSPGNIYIHRGKKILVM